jgi:hypothetical protein
VAYQSVPVRSLFTVEDEFLNALLKEMVKSALYALSAAKNLMLLQADGWQSILIGARIGLGTGTTADCSGSKPAADMEPLGTGAG